MRSIRCLLAALCLAAGFGATPAFAEVNVGISIGINVPTYPRLVPVPGYPVYYAPGLPANYFFYDGLYWVYVGDNWYESLWYNGPWTLVQPAYVPVYILRVPVRYYRSPPPYFHRWAPSAPPRWGERWGPDWEARHRGWEHWNRAQAPRPAPPPSYQRQFSGNRYPQAPQDQDALHGQHYRYQPREPIARERYEHARPVPPAAGRGHGRGNERGDDKDKGRHGPPQ
ncbi:MAG TPA: hypothetical protein VJ743_02345 [Albitalea sp.]|nr:hypothetical protein [Albitalea sp.]